MELLEKIRFTLKETNPWWKRGTFTVENYSTRDIYAAIEKFFKLPQIIALVGLRRTGKTTLMLKIIETYLKHMDRSRILYFSFDDFSSLDIQDILVAYKEIFPEVNLKEEKFLFAFDEIQKLKDWQEKIKHVYDTYPNIKMIVSGSESLFLRKKIKETLGGRIFEFHVSTLKFKEYLEFTKHGEMASHAELYKDDIVKTYRKFLKTNGFPELVKIEDDMVIHKYLRESVVDKIIFRDIPQLFKIKNVDVLGEILDIIIFSPGQLIDVTKLSKELGLTRQVISSYLDYLEKSFLIKKIYNFSRNLRKQKKSLKKYYPAVVFPVIVEERFPACFESSLIWQLNVQFFYRDAYQNEVDAIVLNDDRSVTPIEIKTGAIELKGINYFMEKYKVAKGIVLTLQNEKDRGVVRILPFYKYLFK